MPCPKRNLITMQPPANVYIRAWSKWKVCAVAWLVIAANMSIHIVSLAKTAATIHHQGTFRFLFGKRSQSRKQCLCIKHVSCCSNHIYSSEKLFLTISICIHGKNILVWKTDECISPRREKTSTTSPCLSTFQTSFFLSATASFVKCHNTNWRWGMPGNEANAPIRLISKLSTKMWLQNLKTIMVVYSVYWAGQIGQSARIEAHLTGHFYMHMQLGTKI